MPAAPDQRPQPFPAEQKRGEQCERPDGGNFPGGEGEENDGEDVLHDEDADGDPPVHRAHVAAFTEALHGEDRAGKAQRERQQECGLPGETSRISHQSPHTEKRQREHSDHGKRVQTRPRPDFRTAECPHAEFHPDGEKHERDPEIRHDAERLPTLLPECLEDEAGDQEADQRGQTELLGKQPEEKGDRDKEGIHERMCEARAVPFTSKPRPDPALPLKVDESAAEGEGEKKGRRFHYLDWQVTGNH